MTITMYDLSKETNKSFLKEANKWLQEELIAAHKKIAELELLQRIDSEICTSLSDQLNILRQKFFANKQEKVGSSSGKKREKKDTLIHNKSPLGTIPNDNIELMEEEETHLLKKFNCPCNDENCHLNEMKGCFEYSSEITVTEKKYLLIKHQRQKYKGSFCGKIITAPTKEKLVSGGKFSIQMGVEVACDKFINHMPLERQRKNMENSGLIVDTKTLFSLTEHVYNHLSPLGAKIKEEILTKKCTHIDESPFNFFNPKKSSGFVWSLSNNYGTYYQFEPSRSSAVAKEILGNYVGSVMTDGFSGYNWIEKEKDMIHAYCWAHVRRKFYDSIKDYPIAEEMVLLIDELYDMEHKANNIEELLEIRRNKSVKILEKIDSWILALNNGYLASSSIGKAIEYFCKRKQGLSEFINNPNIPLDNNRAERSQRVPVMGRKNFLFFKSINGADVAMLFYTIIDTCKILNLNPKAYLLEMTLRSARGEELKTPYQYGLDLQELVAKNLAMRIKQSSQSVEST